MKRISELPRVDLTPVRDGVRDVAYMAVGLGAVVVEELQARRRRITEQLNTRIAAEKARTETVRARLEARFAELDQRVEAIEARLEGAVDTFEARLPEQAGHLVGQARNIGRVARQQVRDRIRPAA